MADMSCSGEGELPQVDIVGGFAFISLTTMESMQRHRGGGGGGDQVPDSLFLGDECKQAVAAGILPAAVMSCLGEGDLPQVDIMDGFAFISFTTMESMNGRRADGRRWDLLSGVPSKALSLCCLFQSRASAGTRDGSSLDSYSKDSYSSHFLADSTDSRV